MDIKTATPESIKAPQKFITNIWHEFYATPVNESEFHGGTSVKLDQLVVTMV